MRQHRSFCAMGVPSGKAEDIGKLFRGAEHLIINVK